MKKYVYIFLMLTLLLACIGCAQPKKEQPSKADTQPTTCEVFRIDYDFVMLNNDSVGNNWETAVICNGLHIRSGEKIMVPANDRIIIQAKVTEVDTIPDVGDSIIYITPDNQTDSCTEIIVQENRGRYAGNIATWQLCCHVIRMEAIEENQEV